MSLDEAADVQALRALATRTASAAAQCIDLHRFRQLVHVGGEGEVLAAFLDSWPWLRGSWLGPADAKAAAIRFLGQSWLADRMRYVAGDALAAIPAADLVVLNAVDAGVDRSLDLLVSASEGWLPADG